MRVVCPDPCGVEFEGRRKTAVFCSPRCRKRANRAGTSPVVAAPPVAGPEPKVTVLAPHPDAPPEGVISDFEAATRRAIEELGLADSMLGQQVLIVARRMSSRTETGSALATLSKEHSRLMAALGAGQKQADPVDEVGRRRAEKLARATAR